MSRGDGREPDQATPQPQVAPQDSPAASAAASDGARTDDAQPQPEAEPSVRSAADPEQQEAQDPERQEGAVPAGFGSLRGDWDHASLPANVRLGRDCWLERRDSFTRIRSRRDPALILGDRVRAHSWTTFNIDDDGLVEIGDDCVLVGPVFLCTDRIRLGRRVLISYQVTLADSDFHPLQPELRELDALAIAPSGDPSRRQPFQRAPIEIEDDVQIGIGALILKGVHIGAGARIGAGAVVSRDVPAGAVMLGNPARPQP